MVMILCYKGNSNRPIVWLLTGQYIHLSKTERDNLKLRIQVRPNGGFGGLTNDAFLFKGGFGWLIASVSGVASDVDERSADRPFLSACN